MENDRVVVARERERHASGLLLARVRTQMMDVYRPLAAAVMAALQARRYMARELGFEWLTLTALDRCFMRPSERLYPHLEVLTVDFSPEHWAHARESQGATVWWKHSPGDLQVRTQRRTKPYNSSVAHTLVITLSRSSTISQLLVDDPSKRAIYTDAHSSGMIPRWRDMAAIIATKLALIEAPPPESLAAANPAQFSGVDWAKISAGTLTYHFYDMIAFADAWAAIERRWADGDYSVRAAGPSRAGIPSPHARMLRPRR